MGQSIFAIISTLVSQYVWHLAKMHVVLSTKSNILLRPVPYVLFDVDMDILRSATFLPLQILGLDVQGPSSRNSIRLVGYIAKHLCCPVQSAAI